MAVSYGIALLCTTRSLGGIELNVLRLATWMSERGHRCVVFGVDGAPMLERAAAAGLTTISLGHPRRYGAFREAALLAERMHVQKLDALCVNSPMDLNLGVLARRKARKAWKLLQIQHMQFGGMKRDFFHSWEYSHLDAWIAPLPWLAEQTKGHTRIPPERVHVIPFGVEMEQFARVPAKDVARQRLGLPVDCVLAGTVGRFDRGKGQEFLLRALGLSSDKRLHALLLGEDTRGEGQGYGDELRALVKELKLDGRVHMLPFRQDVSTAYAAMDVFVLTSISETYGMVTIEAMSAGLPVVATNSAGTPDIITHEESGLLVPVRDADAIARALERLRNDSALAQRIGSKARSIAQACYSHTQQCERMEALLDMLHHAS